jgi:hypothetical protein
MALSERSLRIAEILVAVGVLVFILISVFVFIHMEAI